MKLKTGKATYKIPAYSRIEMVCVNGNQNYNSYTRQIQQIPISEIPLDDTRGFPTMWAVHEQNIHFYPVPDHAYQVTGRYTPPVQEF